MARTVKVPAHTRNGKKVKGYSYTVGGKSKLATRKSTTRRKSTDTVSAKDKNRILSNYYGPMRGFSARQKEGMWKDIPKRHRKVK